MKKAIAIIILLTFIFTGGFGKEVHAAVVELYSTSLYSDANLVAYYRLEDATDSQDQGTDYDLTNNNSVTFSSAKFNNGANLGTTNTNKDLSVGNAVSLTATGAFTISCWVKLNTEIGAGATWSFIGQFIGGTPMRRTTIDVEYTGANRTIQFTHQGRTDVIKYINYTQTMGTSNWYYLVSTYAGGSTGNIFSGYVNGNLVGTTTSNYNGTYSAADMTTIGSYYHIQYSSATVDDCAVFSRALSATEILNNYNGPAETISSPRPPILWLE